MFNFTIRYLFRNPNLPEAEVTLKSGRKIHFTGFWHGFQPNDDEFWSSLLDTYCHVGYLRVLVPFSEKNTRHESNSVVIENALGTASAPSSRKFRYGRSSANNTHQRIGGIITLW